MVHRITLNLTKKQPRCGEQSHAGPANLRSSLRHPGSTYCDLKALRAFAQHSNSSLYEYRQARPSVESKFGLPFQRPGWFRIYCVGFTHHPYVFPGAEPFAFRTSCLRICTPTIPESKDRNHVRQRVQNHGSLRVSRLFVCKEGAFIDTHVVSRVLLSLWRKTRDSRTLQIGVSRVGP